MKTPLMRCGRYEQLRLRNHLVTELKFIPADDPSDREKLTRLV